MHVKTETNVRVLLPPAELSSSSSTETLYDVAAFCTSDHTGIELINTLFEINVDRLFNKIFTPSKFLKDFLRRRRFLDLVDHGWCVDKTSLIRCRKINYNVCMFAGSKIKVQETYQLLNCSVPNELYSIDIVSISTGTMYDDCFQIDLHICLSKKTATSTLMLVFAKIVFKKKLLGITKSIIEKQCLNGLHEYYKDLKMKLKEDIKSKNLQYKVNHQKKKKSKKNESRQSQSHRKPLTHGSSSDSLYETPDEDIVFGELPVCKGSESHYIGDIVGSNVTKVVAISIIIAFGFGMLYAIRRT